MQQVHSRHPSQPHHPPDPTSPISSSHHSQSRHRSVNPPPATPPPPLNMVGPSHPMPRQRVYFGPYLLLQTLVSLLISSTHPPDLTSFLSPDLLSSPPLLSFPSHQGEGEFGKVKLGVHSSPDRWGEEVAIKLIKRGNVDTQARMIKVAREIDVLKLVKHPNIVRLYDVIETEKYIGIVLEYASGGELFDHILAHRYLKEKDASKLFAQLISGVTYLHAKKIVHRDLKLENLLLDRNRNIIITDFGFANRFEDRTNDLMATSCGSPCYAAPELVVQDGRYVGSQVDVWSCGVILYAMLAGYLPFDDDPSNPDGDNINLLYKYIINTPLIFPDWISDEPKDLLLKMLVPDPLKRCSLKDVTNHSWLAKYKHLFHRSLEEYERISEDNEQMQRLMLQRQRQLMATNNSHPSRLTLGVDATRAQTSTGATAAHKSRAHQSATVVPSVGILNADDFLLHSHLTGAYQQQQRQVTSGVVMHLQPQPTAAAPNSNRRQHAQSAFIGPVAALRHDAPIASAPVATQDQVMLAGDLQASGSSASSARKRKVGSAAPTTTSASSQQRYTVQVEYTGDSKGKSKNIELSPAVVHHDMDVDGVNTNTAVDEVNSILTSLETNTRLVGVTPAATNPADTKSLATPHPGRTRKPSDHTLSPDARPNLLETPKPQDLSTVDLAGRIPPVTLSPSSTPRKPSAIQETIEAPKNASQVSFSATSQNIVSNALPKPATSNSQNRHRKGLSTDRFLSRLLGTSAAQPTPPPPVPNPKKLSDNNTAPPTVPKTVRRKALSMVVEPLSGKSSSSARHSKKFGGKVSSATANPTESHYPDHSKRRTRGNSVAAPLLSTTTSDFIATSSSKRAAGLPQRRITLNAANGRHSKTSARTASQAASTKTGSQRSHHQTAEMPSNAENNPVQVNPQTASQNWGHHTPAASLANSTGQASNSSKAKRVMDWFRFKSLNGSNISTNQAPFQVHEHLSPPVPIPTDFDARAKTIQGAVSARPDQLNLQAVSGQLVGASLPPLALVPPTPSSKTSHRFTSAQLRPNTSTAAEFPHHLNLPSSVTERNFFNDSKLKLHHGAIDQNAISSKLPPIIMQQLKQILWEMGIDVVEETSMKLKATRRSKKKVVASLGMGVLEALQQQQQQRLNQQEQSTGALKSIFHRRPQTASSTSQAIGVLIDQFGNVTTGSGAITCSGGCGAGTNGGSTGSVNGSDHLSRPQPLPSYADDPSVDSGDDVRFSKPFGLRNLCPRRL